MKVKPPEVPTPWNRRRRKAKHDCRRQLAEFAIQVGFERLELLILAFAAHPRA
jgi:hypothetical protein